MKHQRSLLLVIGSILLLAGTSCTAVEGIFKAGMWWAFFLVAVVIGVILWIVAKTRNK